MRRARGILVLATAVFVAASVGTQDSGAAKSGTTVVGLGLREYRITVYRSAVPTGGVVFNLRNFGEDRHDVQVSGPHGYFSRPSPEVAPFGGTARLTVRLRRPGTYTLICTLPAHEALGMKAKIKVRRRVAPKPVN